MEMKNKIDSSCISCLGRERGDLIWCQVLWMLVFFWWFRKITTYCNHWIWPSQFLHDITPDRKKTIVETAISKKIWQKSPDSSLHWHGNLKYQTLGQRWGFCRFTKLNVDPETYQPCRTPWHHRSNTAALQSNARRPLQWDLPATCSPLRSWKRKNHGYPHKMDGRKTKFPSGFRPTFRCVLV